MRFDSHRRDATDKRAPVGANSTRTYRDRCRSCCPEGYVTLGPLSRSPSGNMTYFQAFDVRIRASPGAGEGLLQAQHAQTTRPPPDFDQGRIATTGRCCRHGDRSARDWPWQRRHPLAAAQVPRLARLPPEPSQCAFERAARHVLSVPSSRWRRLVSAVAVTGSRRMASIGASRASSSLRDSARPVVSPVSSPS